MTTIYNFTGPFNISNWTLEPNTGIINTSNTPLSITLISGNSGVIDNTNLTINIPSDGNVQFTWNSTTIDSYDWDSFGYLLNGVFNKLTPNSGSNPIGGTFTLPLNTNDIFGFNTNTRDGIAGPITTIISNFTFEYNNIPCFKESSKILTDNGYKPIETLRKGDLVKTLNHGFVEINMICKRDIYHNALEERIKDQLYKCSQSEYPEIFEDLIITGCHSILVDDFKEDEREKTIEILKNIYVTDNKYRLPSCVDMRSSVYEIPGKYTIYHLALENNDYYMNYGIYANGLLVETCSKRYLKELSNMILIE